MRRSALFVAPVLVLILHGMISVSEAGSPNGRKSKANRPPRKVVIGTALYGPYGKYPGFEERLKELGGLIDEMARQAAEKYPGRGLDLAILPESAVTPTIGPASERAMPLDGPVRESFG